MLRKLIKNKKAQNTAEYAILISLVVAGIIAMQTYAQRALQAKVRGAAQHLQTKTSDLGNTIQYEPYYLTTQYEVTRNDDDTIDYTNQDLGMDQDKLDNRLRESGGFQMSAYNATANTNW